MKDLFIFMHTFLWLSGQECLLEDGEEQEIRAL